MIQEGGNCYVKAEGLKRGLQNMDSSDYQMGGIITGT